VIGQSISHYKILAKLGEGGMGVVYKAEDLKLKRIVALKFLPSSIMASEAEKARFIHEAQAAAALDHPNICTIHEIDEADRQLFIAMAYIEGQSLKEKIEVGPLKLDEAPGIAMQIAEGLQVAHEKQITPRDIKPAKLFAPRPSAIALQYSLYSACPFCTIKSFTFTHAPFCWTKISTRYRPYFSCRSLMVRI